MIRTISGTLTEITATGVAVLEPAGSGISYEVLLPAYLLDRMRAAVGTAVVLHTLHYLEAQGQGTSFIPRLIGFEADRDRRFFELMTTVKGLGNRKAVRALAAEPSTVAAAIASRDAKALTALPEIGKRLAETMIVELGGKVDTFLTMETIASAEAGLASAQQPAMARPELDLPPAARDAVATLMALGETRAEAERRIEQAMAAVGDEGASAEVLVASALAGR
ncbi:MAG: Holliday junction branch migration protein RuvA [Planctomycetota bacterium]